MAPPKKPADRRQRSNSKDVGAVVVLPSSVVASMATPALHWRPEVAEAWHELWSSPLAGIIKPTDVPALKRLFEYRHSLLHAQEQFEADPVGTGSMGQEVLSPWATEVHRLEGVIEKLEDRFGLTPMSRLRLGVTFEEGVSLANRNAQLLEAFKQSQAR
jgi:P27 family predicted phage terminase small subunit